MDNQKLFIKFSNEDVAVGSWLFPLNVHKIHDQRFLDSYKCSEDSIVLHNVKVRAIYLVKIQAPDFMGTLYNNTKQDSCFCRSLPARH